MIKVALFEDNAMLSDTLSHLLKETEGIAFVGSWSNGSQVDKIINHYRPDVVLMDIDMPEVNGIQSLQVINSKYPDIHVIMLTVFDDDNNVFSSICYGAKGYLLKKTPPDKIIAAIIDVYDGGSPMSGSIARKVLQAFSIAQTPQGNDYKLTKRETDILSSLVDGNSYKMTGSELGISINTVRQYIRRIYEKLQVHSMNEAVAKAIKEKIV